MSYGSKDWQKQHVTKAMKGTFGGSRPDAAENSLYQLVVTTNIPP
jgi:hypothetical protein